ncbi:MAG: 16S rRNA (cytosine(1402)-N(4))-methyltransferase RsmH [Candidatus Moranbacteria bacterium]|nr:16S rRNA (cytosine(1402)-N(4))-methyltransferase RsmH [Candidatus Moranbacteria bacterium]
MIHKSVLLEELLENLKLKPGMTVVDGTLGAGGHSAAVLAKIIPGGRLISIDWDKDAVKNFEKKLEEGIPIAKRELIRMVRSVPVNIKNKNDDQAFIKLGNRGGEIVGYWHGAADNYANIKEILGGLPASPDSRASRGGGIRSVDAVFVDLGFSSDQIENARRGFSFLKNGPLDMRYSPETRDRTAADLVNNLAEDELVRIFKNLGEERFAKRIAREIGKIRKIREIRKTEELVDIISRAVPERYKKGKIHPATRVFQALRIETNQELENLKNFLNQAVETLASKGTLAIISFHSLEDRIVKNFFREEAQDCICPPNFPKCVCGHRARLKIITKKPITASESEVEENPRARSAKLRIAQKV